jgi:tripartite-type tricarboxylate transporter receptor subunit TctC
MNRRHVVAGGLLGAAAGLWARPALAQAVYPSRPIRVIVPIAAGGGTDILVRLIAPRAAALLSGTIVVENRAGAEGVIGTEYVVRAPADGHTLLFSDSSIHINKVSRANLPYDPMTDVLPVIRAAYGSFVLYGNRNFGARNLAELIEKAKARSGSVSYGTGSTGAYLLGELLKRRAGIEMEHVLYRSGMMPITDTISGHITLTINGASIGKPFVQTGELLAIGVTGPRRNAALPEVPTFEEQGYSGFPSGSEWGLFAPVGVPQPLIDRLHAAFAEAIFDPAIAGRLAELGYTPDRTGGETYMREKAAEMAIWNAVAAAAGLTPQ